MMAAFDMVADGVRSAADIQRNLATYNALAPETLRARIGIHAGEPVADHNDLFGATVQLAHGCAAARTPAASFVSELVRSLCEEDAARFEPLGEWQLKGVAESIPVFRFERWK